MRYHFNIEGTRSHQDKDGTELANLGEAKREAGKVLADVLAVWPTAIFDADPLQLTVTDESGLILIVVHVNAVTAAALSGQKRS